MGHTHKQTQEFTFILYKCYCVKNSHDGHNAHTVYCYLNYLVLCPCTGFPTDLKYFVNELKKIIILKQERECQTCACLDGFDVALGNT